MDKQEKKGEEMIKSQDQKKKLTLFLLYCLVNKNDSYEQGFVILFFKFRINSVVHVVR